MTKELTNKFLELMKKDKLLPPVHNTSVIASGAGGFLPNFGEIYYTQPINQRFLIIMKENQGIVYMSETQYEKISEDFFKQYWKNTNVLEKRKELFEKFAKKIDEIYNKATYEYIEKNDYPTLIKDLKEIIEANRSLNCSAWYSTHFNKEFCLELIKELNINIPEQRLNEIWDQAITPASKSFDKKRLLDILNALKKQKDFDKLSEPLQYLNSNYHNVDNLEKIKEFLEEEYGNFDDEKINNKINELESESKEKQEKFKEWLKTLSDEEQKLVNYIQAIIQVRDSRKDPIYKGVTTNFKITQKMFKEAKIPEELIYFYSYEELLKGYGYLLKNKENILKRKNGLVFIQHADGSTEHELTNFNETKEKMEKKFLSQENNNTNTSTIKGQTGSPGKIKGIVKIIRDPKNANNFEDGNILVTGMTRPEFIPLMKKASAIITDEGGITCHAAIVSRELNKPCIIGTKIATQILKDGDLVEVDANNGTVKILENNLNLDKSLDYQRHQRDYPILGVAVVLKGFHNENKKFFGVSPRPIFLIVKDEIFYHFMSKHDAIDRSESWLKKYDYDDLIKMDKKFEDKVKEFNEFYGKKPKDPIKELERVHNYLIDFSNIIFPTYEIPEYFKDKIPKKLFNLLMKLRKKYENVHKRCLSKEVQLSKALEREYNLPDETISYLIVDEFENFVKTKKLPNDFNLAQRKRFFILRDDEQGQKTFFNESLWEEFQEEAKNEELTGQIACKGIVKGKVRIIKKVKDAEDFKEGEILVASMTDPRYVPIMKMAAAIITNEGGITCHAAIVSRELGVPCIIGTKRATHVLKNGDLVDVDADHGIIKILEKNG